VIGKNMITQFNNNYDQSVSFKGATKLLQRTIFTRKEDFNAILNCSNSEIVGYLPKDMINFVIKNSKNKEIKNNFIKDILGSFVSVSKDFQKFCQRNDYWEFSLEERNATMIGVIKNKLNNVFKERNLFDDLEQIEVKALNHGSYGCVFKLQFLQKTQIKALVYKVFPQKKESEFFSSMPVLHGKFAENNNMLYVTNLFKKAKEKSVFAQGYFGSLKSNFLVTEYVSDKFGLAGQDWLYSNFGQKLRRKISAVLEKYNLIYKDYRSENIIGEQIIDFWFLCKIKK